MPKGRIINNCTVDYQTVYMLIMETQVSKLTTISLHFFNSHSNITELVSGKILFNTLYDWRILLNNAFQPYLSFNIMKNEKSVLMMPISYIVIILSLMVK